MACVRGPEASSSRWPSGSTNSAVAAHCVEAERLVEALPLASKRGDWEQQARLATIHALLAIAASLLEPAS